MTWRAIVPEYKPGLRHESVDASAGPVGDLQRNTLHTLLLRTATLVIVDQTLRDYAGHHCERDHVVVQAAQGDPACAHRCCPPAAATRRSQLSQPPLQTQALSKVAAEKVLTEVHQLAL